MNLYIVVEGEQTETKVYPAWLQILVPQLHRIDDAWNLSENSDSYYLFSAGGIPSIYKHVSNAVADINEINACGKENMITCSCVLTLKKKAVST